MLSNAYHDRIKHDGAEIVEEDAIVQTVSGLQNDSAPDREIKRGKRCDDCIEARIDQLLRRLTEATADRRTDWC